MDIISEHCTTIRNKGQELTVQHLNGLYNEILIRKEKHHADINSVILCETLLNALDTVNIENILCHPIILTHTLHIFIIDTLNETLKRWQQSPDNISHRRKTVFHHITNFLSNLIDKINENNLKNFQILLLHNELIYTINNILMNMDHHEKYLNSDLVQYFSTVIKIFTKLVTFNTTTAKLTLILDPIVKLHFSTKYIEAFKALSQRTPMTSKQEFLLITCPLFLFNYQPQCEYSEETEQFLTSKSVTYFTDIFEYLLPTISEWNEPIIVSMSHLMNILYRLYQFSSISGYDQLISYLIQILNDNDAFSSKTQLKDATLMLIFNLIKNFALLAVVKQLENVTQTFLTLLTKGNDNRLVLFSYLILVNLAKEDVLTVLPETTKIIALFPPYLEQVVQRKCLEWQGVNLEDLLNGLKVLAQNDKTRKALDNNNYSSSFVQCALKTRKNEKILKLILEILWLLSFDPDIASYLQHQDKFMSFVKTINKKNYSLSVKEAAEGLQWKLETEFTLIKKSDELRRQQKRVETEQ
ncbi:unnamed protein product, partial [Didymodactylos carnosus]